MAAAAGLSRCSATRAALRGATPRWPRVYFAGGDEAGPDCAPGLAGFLVATPDCAAAASAGGLPALFPVAFMVDEAGADAGADAAGNTTCAPASGNADAPSTKTSREAESEWFMDVSCDSVGISTPAEADAKVALPQSAACAIARQLACAHTVGAHLPARHASQPPREAETGPRVTLMQATAGISGSP